ncbi:MAG: serine hydrolase, partial [Isosphaeraceae bacterium]
MSHHTRLTTSLVLFVTAFAQAGELPTAEPDAIGLSPGKLDRLKPALRKLVDDGKIPGGVAVVARRGKVAYVASFGYRNLESKEPMTVDTIFAIASFSGIWVAHGSQGKSFHRPCCDSLPAKSRSLRRLSMSSRTRYATPMRRRAVARRFRMLWPCDSRRIKTNGLVSAHSALRFLPQRTKPLRGGKDPGLVHKPSASATRPIDSDFAPC